MAKYISFRLLVKAGCCDESLSSFERLFGKESNIVIDKGFAKLNFYKFSWCCAAKALLSKRTFGDYNAESLALWRVYSPKYDALPDDCYDKRDSLRDAYKLKQALIFVKYYNQRETT